MKRFVPVRDLNPEGDRNAVLVDFHYEKVGFNRKGRGYYLSAIACKKGADGCFSFLISDHWPKRLVEPANKLSGKRLAELDAKVGEQIEQRAGAAWELVREVCDRGRLAVEGGEEPKPLMDPETEALVELMLGE